MTHPSSPGSSGYQSPDSSEPDDSSASSESREAFLPPQGQEAMASEAAEAEANAFLASVDSQLMVAKAELENLLAELSSDEEGIQPSGVLDANVAGVGIGVGDGSTPGTLPGDPVLVVYTVESEAPQLIRARLADSFGTSALADSDLPIQCVRTGIIDAFSHRFRERPAPCGISVGHTAITAGTIGALCRGRNAPRNQRLMVLSNNHVLANSNAARIGDAIVQPGPADGGRVPQATIAVLERFVPINFSGGNNLVDAATAWAWPERVRREFVYLSGSERRYFNVGAAPVAAVPGLAVGKSGRTTQLTSGRVTAVGVTVNVNFGGRIAKFVNQIAVRASSGDFSQGGDSGSLIWTWDSRRAPVGLLFAGGGGTTFANRISDVLRALDINLVV